MTQEEFKRLLKNALAGGISGYFTSKYSWKEAILDWVKQQKG